ncbi:protein artichoke isoform X1 [Harpegnathos saltator]|nr:protein artichoke isoform X1 [Harpegnathos saltator]XP_011147037.1 protein artichoke isoform X1 [Harpegnathos saltator]
MEIPAAWLLTIFLVATGTDGTTMTTSPSYNETTTVEFSLTSLRQDATNATTTSGPVQTENKFMNYARPFTNVKDILMQEIRTLGEDTSDSSDASDAKIQEEVAETFKAEAQRDRANLLMKTTAKPSRPSKPTMKKANVVLESEKLQKFDDMPYEDELSDEYADLDDEDDDIGDIDKDLEDELNDEESVMMECPDHCKCAGQYAAAMTASCSKLVEGQTFGPGIAHLRLENAGEIRLGPNALRVRGLQQLESITIVDTRIVELDRTAFNGISYLFAVNLTRNGLHDIHPNTFQNNSQLSLLTIADNPLKHTQDTKGIKHYLLHAPSVTDFDFSNNGLLRLKRTAFSKMQAIEYISLRGNWLKEIEPGTFDSLKSLAEVDLSENLLDEIPSELFNMMVQTLRMSENNLSTLSIINASKLLLLDASKNRIKTIGKEDLKGVPLLEQLQITSNNLKRIHPHAFNHLDQLTYVDISDNNISSLTEHHFRANARLQVLLMNDNPSLQILPVFKTSGLTYETFSTFRFECENCGLKNIYPQTFDEMPALNKLNLARNQLEGLPNGLLSQLSSLRDLDLSDNMISTLQPDMFHGAESLGKLNLAGNPLRTLQVTPFLKTPVLFKLDVSRCSLERVWSEARVPLKSLKFLSVRDNLLRRITVEELKATPKLSGLDLSHNPMDCDNEFNEAVQWLTDRGVKPTEMIKYYSDFLAGHDGESDGISEWTDLAKTVCDGIEDGPPIRQFPDKNEQSDILPNIDHEDTESLLKQELDQAEKLLKLDVDHGMRQAEDHRLLEDRIYGEEFAVTTEYHSGLLWICLTIILLILALGLFVVHIVLCLAKRRGRGPVLRPPMILRQGLVDNKNCGLVYKPLQEEIATPHMPKRGSFYSSSTFHYDKIVPESV